MLLLAAVFGFPGGRLAFLNSQECCLDCSYPVKFLWCSVFCSILAMFSFSGWSSHSAGRFYFIHSSKFSLILQAKIPEPDKADFTTGLSSPAVSSCVLIPNVCLYCHRTDVPWMVFVGFIPFERDQGAGQAAVFSTGLCFHQVSKRHQAGAGSSRICLSETRYAKVITSGMGPYHISPSSAALFSSIKSKDQFLDNEKCVAFHSCVCGALREITEKLSR